MRTLLWLSMLAAVTAAHAGDTFRIQNFTSTAPGSPTKGDRWFIGTGFAGSSTIFDDSNLGHFTDGWLVNNTGTYGWNVQVPGDFSSSNHYSGNPDRGDLATPFSGEGNNPKSGTLREVFESRNLAYLIDGEDQGSWRLNLLYGQGRYIVADAGNANTVELMILERGANSRLGVRPILGFDGGGNPIYGTSITLDFGTGALAHAAFTDYSLDTLEIDNVQQVSGIGVDLSAFGLSEGTKVYGFKLFAEGSFNGPDVIGVVGSAAPVPEPATLFALGAGAAALLRRRRRS